MAYSILGTLSYGDIDHVKEDALVIRQIINRQGFDLLLECIAEYIGESNVKYGLTEKQIETLKKSLADSLIELINERV